MLVAIQNYHIEGIATTLDFGAYVMKHPDFVSGHFDTNFVNKNWKPEKIKSLLQADANVAAWVLNDIINKSDLKLNTIL
jgi:acetyl/propionyl-CoA carboxylase alpha subunit